MEKERGVTLIEIIVVITLISVITGVMIADFPRIRLQLSLSRAAHKIFYDIKTARNLSGSSAKIVSDNQEFFPKGYGVFFDSSLLGDKKYIIYADIDGDRKYSQDIDKKYKEVDLNQTEQNIIISEIRNATSRLSINFNPPNFDTTITNLLEGREAIEIILAISGMPGITATRTVLVNKSGLIEMK